MPVMSSRSYGRSRRWVPRCSPRRGIPEHDGAVPSSPPPASCLPSGLQATGRIQSGNRDPAQGRPSPSTSHTCTPRREVPAAGHRRRPHAGRHLGWGCVRRCARREQHAETLAEHRAGTRNVGRRLEMERPRRVPVASAWTTAADRAATVGSPPSDSAGAPAGTPRSRPGWRPTVIQAPPANLLTKTTSSVAPVTTAPSPLMAAFRPPATRPVPVPVDHHAGLREGVGQERAHGEKRDQGVAIAAEDHDQRGRGQRQGHDPVGEYQPVAQAGELPRQEAVLRQQRGQLGETGETGIGRRSRRPATTRRDVAEHRAGTRYAARRLKLKVFRLRRRGTGQQRAVECGVSRNVGRRLELERRHVSPSG